jgi:hypothetical protein
VLVDASLLLEKLQLCSEKPSYTLLACKGHTVQLAKAAQGC